MDIIIIRMTCPNQTQIILTLSEIVIKKDLPKGHQALIFNSVDGIPQKEYIVASGLILYPKNVIFVSRISDNRFCIFLSNKST